MDYWKECIAEAFDDAGITATEDQIITVADWIEGAHENFGMANGYDVISSPAVTELKSVKKELQTERDKVRCYQCKGTGYYMGYDCWECNGTGRV